MPEIIFVFIVDIHYSDFCYCIWWSAFAIAWPVKMLTMVKDSSIGNYTSRQGDRRTTGSGLKALRRLMYG